MAKKRKKQRTSSALYLDNAALPPDVFSARLMNSFSRTAVGGKRVTARGRKEKNKQTEGKKKKRGREREDGDEMESGPGGGGGGETEEQRGGDNSANGATVWIFSRSRNGDYDLAISVTRFY